MNKAQGIGHNVCRNRTKQLNQKSKIRNHKYFITLCSVLFTLCTADAVYAYTHAIDSNGNCSELCTVNNNVLTIGNGLTIPLFASKNTAPAMDVKYGDTICYIDMVSGNSGTSLTLVSGGNTYHQWSTNQIDCPSVTNNFVINDGQLVSAPEGVYLQSSGTQLIDTEYVPLWDTRTEIELRFSGDTYSADRTKTNQIFSVSEQSVNTAYSVNFGSNSAQGYTLFNWLCRYGTGNNPQCQSATIIINAALKTTKQTLIFDIKNKIISYGNVSGPVIGTRVAANTSSLVVFGHKNGDTGAVSSYQKNAAMYVYSVKIYENDVLMRYLVPVPSGLQIGNYTVPSNGMWDIVEQQFHGNIGTGDFIYGQD